VFILLPKNVCGEIFFFSFKKKKRKVKQA